MNRRAATLFVVLALLLSACQEARDERSKVLDFIANTEALSRDFVYKAEDDLGQKIEVKGQIEDGFRLSGLLSIDGAQVAEVIFDDDALALRALDPSKLPSLQSAGFSQVVLDRLNSGQWVVDPSGAPPLRVEVSEQAVATQNDFQEAATALRYVRAAIGGATEVKRWREEDLEPAYRPSEDKFPKPREADVRRYDLVRPPVPRPARQLGALDQEPTTSMFRRMAIYVSGNRVLRVLEQIDIAGHPDFVEARKEKKKQMLDYLKQIQGLSGTQAINQREMSLVFTSFGKKIQIRQPTDALRASLKGLFGPAAAASEPAGDEPASGQGEEPQVAPPVPAPG